MTIEELKALAETPEYKFRNCWVKRPDGTEYYDEQISRDNAAKHIKFFGLVVGGYKQAMRV